MAEIIITGAYIVVLPVFVITVLWAQRQAKRDGEELAKTVRSLAEGVKQFKETVRGLREKVEGIQDKPHSEGSGRVLTSGRVVADEMVCSELEEIAGKLELVKLLDEASPSFFTPENWEEYLHRRTLDSSRKEFSGALWDTEYLLLRAAEYDVKLVLEHRCLGWNLAAANFWRYLWLKPGLTGSFVGKPKEAWSS